MSDRKSWRGWTLRRATRAGGRLVVYTVALFTGLWSTAARAQMCGDTFLVNDNPSDVIQIDTSTNPWTFSVLGNAGVQLNALAFRPADNTLYAMQVPGNTLVRVNLDGSATPLGAVTGLPTNAGNYHVAEFAPDGLMYVRSTGDTTTMYRIDVDAVTATPLSLSTAVNFADVATVDGLLYGVASQGLVAVDPGTGMVNTIGGPFVGGFGAMIPASNGVFGLQNGTGAIFQFDITTGEGTQVAQADPTSNVDGTRCFEAPLEFDVDLSVTKDDGSDTYLPGSDVVYEIVVTNNGPSGVQNALVEDPLPAGIATASWTCNGAAGGVCGEDSGSGGIVDTPDLPVGASVTYTLTLSVPSDFSGELENTVTVELPEGFLDPSPDNNTATDVDQSELEPGISLEKSGSGPEPLEVGATIDYSFLVTNVGNIELTNVTVTDPLPGLSPISCPQTTLAAKEEMTCTADYTVTQEDVDAGVIENTATVTGQPPGGQPPVEDESSATFPPEQAPGISLEKSGSGPVPLEVGATIDYSFLVTNTGNVTLTNVTVTDPLPGLSPISCPNTTLAPGAEMTCTATYTVTQQDVDAGAIENTATVTGTPPAGLPPPTDTDTTTFPPDQSSGISIEKSGSGPEPLTVGSTIEYEFVVTNIGNVTLSNIVITDPLDGLSPISCPATTLSPGADMTCTATYTVTQADVDAGVIQNTATVTGQSPGGGPSATDADTTQFPPVPPVPALPPLAIVLLVALVSLSSLWALRRARA